MTLYNCGLHLKFKKRDGVKAMKTGNMLPILRKILSGSILILFVGFVAYILLFLLMLFI